jgi:hypothetical protein
MSQGFGPPPTDGGIFKDSTYNSGSYQTDLVSGAGSFDFGTVAQNASAVNTFYYFVAGTFTETITSETVSAGFTIQPLQYNGTTTVLPQDYGVAIAGSTTQGQFFRITMDTSTPGVKSGTFTMVWSEDGGPQPNYTFTLAGNVTAPATGGSEVIGSGVVEDDA